MINERKEAQSEIEVVIGNNLSNIAEKLLHYNVLAINIDLN